MTPNKQETEQQNKQQTDQKVLQDLVFFQNLIPGKQESPLIQQFRKMCIDTEENEQVKNYREGLLNNTPPTLTFRNKQQEEDFYKKEAKNCSEFCCGGVAFQGDSLASEDNYKLSIGNGTLYEGSAKDITTQLQKDISSETFGSSKQEQGINGLKEFSKISSQREERGFTSQQSSQSIDNTTSSPLQTEPKPWKE